MIKEIQERILFLETKIKEANIHYYNYDNPIMSDEEYDNLIEELKKIDPDNQVLSLVGNKVESNNFFLKEEHDTVGQIVGSQNKVNTKEEFEKELENKKELSFVITPKMDGITVVLTYTNDNKINESNIKKIIDNSIDYVKNSDKPDKEKTKLVDYIEKQKTKFNYLNNNLFNLTKIVSRGDGFVGENITLNAINFKNLIKSLDVSKLFDMNEIKEITIRGEAVTTFEDFEKIKDKYKNPRNAVALHRSQDGENTELITVIPFDLYMKKINGEYIYFNKVELLELLESVGFKVPRYEKFDDKEKMYQRIQDIFLEMREENNKKWDYLMDGVIISIDDQVARQSFGHVGNKPKGEFAYKPPKLSTIGILKKPEELIEEFTVGKTGNITPMFHLKDEVLVLGSSIKKASGANVDKLKELLPFYGANVFVSKMNEVIPKITKNIDFLDLYNAIEKYIKENNLLNKELEELIKKDELHLKINYYIYDHGLKSGIRLFLKKYLNEKILDEKINKLINDILKNESIINSYKKFEKNKIIFPNNCPSCGSELVAQNVHIKCLNKNCEAKIKAKLLFFIKSLSEGINKGKITELVERNLIKDFHDFFYITEDKFLEINIEETKKVIIKDFINNDLKITEENIVDIDENSILLSFDKDIEDMENKINNKYKIIDVDFDNNRVEIKNNIGLKKEYIKGWEKKSVQEVITSINKLKKQKDNELFGSLNFENIGSTVFLKLFQEIDYEELKKEILEIDLMPENLKENEKDFLNYINNHSKKDFFNKLLKIKDFGYKSIIMLVNTWLEDKDTIEDLIENIEIEKTKKLDKDNKVYTVVITGSILPSTKWKDRNSLTKLLKELGYTVSGSVTSKTDFLITDDQDLNSGKAKDAKKIISENSNSKLKIITSKEFEEIFENSINKKTINKNDNV